MTVLNQLCNLGLTFSGETKPYAGQKIRTLRHSIIEYPEFIRAVREIARLHQRWIECETAGAMLIVGQSGSGKSTLLKYYVERFPRERTPRRTRTPVLTVLTPEAPTVKSFSEAFLVALGDPTSARGSAAVKTQRITHFIKECEVQLILIDEFHHFCDSRAPERSRVTDWLKNLLNDCNIPIVLFGLPKAIFALHANEQLRRRFASPHYCKEFGFRTEGEQALFRSVLKHFQDLTHLPWAVDLSQPDVALRFHYATNGLIDYVVKILEDVVARFPEIESQRVGYEELQISFERQVWADVPAALNPFNPKGVLRRLDQENEPFSIWDDPKNYTLSKRAAAMRGRK